MSDRMLQDIQFAFSRGVPQRKAANPSLFAQLSVEELYGRVNMLPPDDRKYVLDVYARTHSEEEAAEVMQAEAEQRVRDRAREGRITPEGFSLRKRRDV